MNPTRYLLEIFRYARQTRHDVRNLLPQRIESGRQRHLRRAQLKPERHEPLLRTVVQVAFESSPGGVGRSDDPGSRSRELLAGVCVGDRGRYQVREVPDARL